MDSNHERAVAAHARDHSFHHLAPQRGREVGERGVAAKDQIELFVGNDVPDILLQEIDSAKLLNQYRRTPYVQEAVLHQRRL